MYFVEFTYDVIEGPVIIRVHVLCIAGGCSILIL